MRISRCAALLVFCTAFLGGPALAAEASAATPAAPADQGVTGIGGFFFRAHDPKALALWYQQRLGISLIPSNYHDQPWRQAAGPTAFAPFSEKTKMIDAGKDWMLNLRVRDLDGLTARLRAAGITVTVDPQAYPNGRFAELHDPEGNQIQLWEPK